LPLLTFSIVVGVLCICINYCLFFRYSAASDCGRHNSGT